MLVIKQWFFSIIIRKYPTSLNYSFGYKAKFTDFVTSNDDGLRRSHQEIFQEGTRFSAKRQLFLFLHKKGENGNFWGT